MTDVSQTQPMEPAVSAEIERRYRQPNLCTIFEADVPELEKMSRWITAKGNAFVDLQSYR